jgi:hypothetical protein
MKQLINPSGACLQLYGCDISSGCMPLICLSALSKSGRFARRSRCCWIFGRNKRSITSHHRRSRPFSM